MDPFAPLSLDRVLQLCQTKLSPLATLDGGPLRCMVATEDKVGFQVVPFPVGKKYIAISYSWPNKTWTRLYNSNRPSWIFKDNCAPEESEHVSGFASSAIQSLWAMAGLADAAIWCDHECIDQADLDEKQGQIAIMDKIYTLAQCTAILLEDVELSTEEFGFLCRCSSLDTANRARYRDLVRRILAARWFDRAWCTQEMVLSKGSLIFVHCTGEPTRHISFAFTSLTGWTTKVAIHDPHIKYLTEPRGINLAGSLIGRDTFAWAWGLVYAMGCYNEYDKVALVLNLVRAAPDLRLTKLPDSEGRKSCEATTNVYKLINVNAILSQDFSLLVAGHAADNPVLKVAGFSWGSVPVASDNASESWHPKNYSVAKDPNPAISAGGIASRGIAAKVMHQANWQVWRDCNDCLFVDVDGSASQLHSTWLSNPAFEREYKLGLLRDVLCAIEALDAKTLYYSFLPPDPNWTYHPLFTGELKEDIMAVCARIWPLHRYMGQVVKSMQHDGKIRFSHLKLEGGHEMTVFSNANTCKDRVIFQPYVIRPKEFGGLLLTANAMVFENEALSEHDQWHACVGHVRGFQLIPDEYNEVCIKIK